MAYSAPFNHNNRSPQLIHEQQRSPWATHNQPRPQNHMSMPPAVPNTNSIFDPESEDSDVSYVEGDYGSAFALPINLPPPPSKQALEDPDTLTAHLHELERVEDHNVRKQKRLQEKRKRKDDKILHYRAIQDEKIKAIMDARVRRDARINARRERENIAFARFFEESEEIETRLRQRLKRLKRGLPVEEPTPGSRRVSMNSINSMSPSGPSYSTIPPPAKRHQTSHPGTTDLSMLNRAHDPGPYTPAPPPPSQPSYQFYPSSRPQQPLPPQQPQLPPQPQYQPQQPPPPQQQQQQQSTSQPPVAPYRPVPIYAPAASPPLQPHNNIGPPRHEPHSYASNVPHGSPHMTKLPPPSSTPNPLPPKHPSASYDTRPPPPPGPPSGFPAVNQPPPTGFSAINSRPTATPPVAHTVPLPDHSHEQSTSVDRTPSRGPPSEDKSNGGGNGANKRTPSTTHPYQMSEAFANRHHHCERTDSLNRGIWTWYGPGGTQENPVTAPTEMYLKCNHDGCGRIDWRTVHGLQCHIVKNHEQPKGTIGSLEKALERYGVPVSHIEEIERRDGLGSGGTMADPKNFRIKNKTRESGDRADFGRRSTPSSMPKSQAAHASGSPVPFNVPTRPNYEMGPQQQHRDQASKEGTVHSPIDVDKTSQIPRPIGGFAAVNSSWQGVNSTPSNSINPKKNEWKGWSMPTPTPSEQTPSAQRTPTMDIKNVSLPPWQAPTEPTRAPAQSPSMNSERTSRPHVQLPSPELNIKDQRSPANSGDRTHVHAGATPKEAMVPNAEKPLEDRPHVQENSASEKSPVDPPANSNAIPPNEVINEVTDTLMTDVKPEEGPTGKDEQVSEDKTSAEQREIQDRAEQHTSPMASTEITSAQNTPRRRREDARKEDSNRNSEQDSTRAISTEEDSKMVLRSPEVPQRRIVPSRRESRRSSMATAASSRLSTDKMKEDDNETVSTVNTASKADSVEDDSDSITVAPRGTIDRQRDRDRGKDTPKRQANGRFSRKGR